MLSCRVLYKTIISIFLCYASIIHAQTNTAEDITMCPSIDTIHQAAPLVNQVEKDCGDGVATCVSSGTKPAFNENGKSWELLSLIYPASTDDEAIHKAQLIATHANVMLSSIMFDGWLKYCMYFVTSSDSSENMAIEIVATPIQDESSSMSFIHSFLKSKK